MQSSRPVLLTAAACGAAAIVGALFGADQFAAQAGTLALGSLTVHVVVSRRSTVRRVWWSLLGGIAVLAVAVAVPDIWSSPVSGPQRLEPAAAGSGTFVQDVIAGEWLTTLAVLLASAAFLSAATAAAAKRGAAVAKPTAAETTAAEPAVRVLTARRRVQAAIVTALAGSLLILVAVADLGLVAAGQTQSGAAGELVAAVGFPLVVALFAIVSAVLGAYRLTSRTAAAGGLLPAVSALGVVYLGVLSAPLPYGYARHLIFDAAVVRTGWGVLDPIAALMLTGMLAGAGAVVLGCLPEARRRI